MAVKDEFLFEKIGEMRNGYLEISNSVIAAKIDGTIMLFCAIGAFFAIPAAIFSAAGSSSS